MKKLLTIIAFAFSFSCYGQIDQAVKGVVKTEITEFGNTLDSLLIIEIDTIGTFNVDTLFVKDGSVRLFELTLTGVGSSVVSAKKYAVISNIGGKYSIVRNLNPVTYSGYTGSKWDLLLQNGFPVIRITSPSFTKWVYKKY